MKLTEEKLAELKAPALHPEEARGTLVTVFGCGRESTLANGVLALLADLEDETTRTSHYKDVAEQINSELELVRAEKDIVRGIVTERDGIIARMQTELAATRQQLAEAQARECPNLEPVINWLVNGCDPQEAAKELRIYQRMYHSLDGTRAALQSAIAEAVEPYKRNAERWRKLKPSYTAAVFDPEREDGLDLGEGVALIFMLPKGSAVSANADATIDAISAKEAT